MDARAEILLVEDDANEVAVARRALLRAGLEARVEIAGDAGQPQVPEHGPSAPRMLP